MEDLYQSYEEPYRAVTTLDTNQLDPNTIRIFHHIERFKMFYRIVFSKNVPLTYYYMLFDGIYSLLKTRYYHTSHTSNGGSYFD